MAASCLVCATPRSGGTLLCEALKGTGVEGARLARSLQKAWVG